MAVAKAKSRRPALRKPVAKRPAVRRKVAAPRARAVRAAPKESAAEALRLAGVGSAAVLRATGRAWDEWLKVLDRAGAEAMAHKDIALMLSRKFSVPDWWCQMVTVGYEQARGLRVAHQKADGFSATASKTVDAPLADLYAAWSESARRAKWLPKAPLEVRTSRTGKSMRITWGAGGSSVDVNFYAKAPRKSLVQLEHRKLADGAAVARQKAYWAEALTRLKAFLERTP